MQRDAGLAGSLSDRPVGACGHSLQLRAAIRGALRTMQTRQAAAPPRSSSAMFVTALKVLKSRTFPEMTKKCSAPPDFGSKRNVLRMFHHRAVAIFKINNELPKRRGAYKPVNFTSERNRLAAKQRPLRNVTYARFP
jgi:hypothetical protein